MSKSTRKLTIISLFSGAGGLDLGLIQAGHKVIWANDFDLDCSKTYKLNIGNHIIHEDLTRIPSKSIPVADVVVGGFPCQGFSQANLLRVLDDNRNALYREFYRIVKDKQPKWFLAENVKGILNLAGGAAIEQIIEDFKTAGYRVQIKLFNCADYGVPQTRQRVIIAGTRNDLEESMDYVYPSATHSKILEANLKPWVTVSEALHGIPEPTDHHDLENHVCSQYKITNRNFTGHRKTDGNKPSPTILARGNGGGGVCAIQHPQNHRRMSIREQATIQTFPIDFEFIGKMGSAYRQVGNAVPVRFAEALGRNLGRRMV